MKTDSVKCDPNEVAVKSLFLGPGAENAPWMEETLREIFFSWYRWRSEKNANDGLVISDNDKKLYEFIGQQERTRSVVRDVLTRFESEIPKFSPRYIGHMFSEISMPALLGHFITLLHNPNNISPEASKVGSQIELEAIAELSKLVGYSHGHGHFTSGGTVANFEFLFRARERLALWLASSLATGERNVISGSLIGWDNFDRLNKKISKSDLEPFYFLNNQIQSYKNICKVSGQDFNSPVLIVPCSKHYSWPKAMHYLGLGESSIRYIDLDCNGRSLVKSLNQQIQNALDNNEPILGVVAVAGTTELGTIDPIDEFVRVVEHYKNTEGLDIWLHIDAAYGGFFRSVIGNSTALEAIARSNSVTLDPHKLGYVPYSSGTFLCKHERDYSIKSFTGPYIVSDANTLGNFTLEGSRSAAGAVATFTSIKSFESVQGYSRILKRTLAAKTEFETQLKDLSINIYCPGGLDTNIVCFTPIGKVQNLSKLNEQTLKLYKKMEDSHQYWISKTKLDSKSFRLLISSFCSEYNIVEDCETLDLLRLTLMNPFVLSKESSIDHVSSFCTLLKKEFLDLQN